MNRIVASLFFTLFGFSAHAQQGTVTGPFSPCSAFGTTSGTCLQGAGALGSPLSIGTLPAFTLGGTISGGGNQINNVSIGTLTPLPGAFTTLTASTSATFGPGGTGGTALYLLLNGGSGTAGGAAMQFQKNSVNDWGIGERSAIVGSGTSSNLLIQRFGTGAALEFDATTLAATLSGDVSASAQMFMPNITSQSTAANGSICWTTGTGKFTVDTTLACLTSSARFKNLIGEVPTATALDIVDRLRTVSFTRKAEFGGNTDPAEQFGFTAEQAASVDERLIARGVDGEPLGVRYMEFTAVLAGAVQQLKADNDNLRICQQNWKCRIFGIGG